MIKTKKILILTSVLIILATTSTLFKLSTSGFKSNYIKEKLSLYILDQTEINTEITNVNVKLDSKRGLIFEIPLIKSIEKTDFDLQDTIVDISTYSILWNGIVSSEINTSSTVNIQNNNPKVKISSTNICHEKGSQYYKQTKKYESFNTIEDCLNSGGRLPR